MKYLRGFLLIIIFIIGGFLLGGWISSLSVPKGSGLAGPGIVAGSGILGAVAGIIISIILIRTVVARRIVLLNIIFGIGVLITIALITLHNIWKKENSPSDDSKKITTIPIVFQKSAQLGLGMAFPDMYDQKVLYFYSPNLEKSVDDHTPTDSLVFTKTELGISITSAPPWFYPAHMKMDYEILAMKAISKTKDWIQLEVNKQTGLTHWVDANKVVLKDWPDFLLSTSSIELFDPVLNMPKVRPFDHSSPIQIPEGNIFTPIEISDEWLRVKVLDHNYKKIGEGWVRWRRENQLLVRYNLLS